MEIISLLVVPLKLLAAQLVQQRAAVQQPQAILCVGQAAGRSAVTPELIGINYQHASLPDNAGVQPQDMPIIPDGPDAIFSTLPVQAMAGAIRAAGLPVEFITPSEYERA